jgi:hypothetical protein
MKKYIILAILFAGCNTSEVLSQKDLLTTEGFIAVSVAVNQKSMKAEEEKKLIEIQAKENAAILEKEIEEQKKIEAELEAKRIAEENIVKTPKKYLRLFSVDEGCGHCIRQDQILLGSDWKIYNGTEKDNQDKIPYHGIKESAKDLVVKSDLWEKYKAKSVPFWQLIEDGKVVKTYSGVLTLPELREFYLNLKTGEKHNNPDCTCENCKCGSTCKCD